MESEDPQSRFLSTKSLSRFLDIPENTIRSWVRTKEIPYYKIGKLIRFDVKEVEKKLIKVDIENNKRELTKRLKFHAKV